MILERIIISIEDIMNYYGTGKYIEEMKRLDEQVFSKIRFDEPEREKELESGYLVRYYYYADEENREPGHAPVDGEICRLFKDDRMVFEWKNTDGNSRMACIIHHADGNTYFVFDEDLYGYSVLDLNTLECMHYLPAESYGETPKETFIWCDCFYNAVTDQLAVDGCFWASPDNVIVLDLTDPMTPVEANKWIDLYEECSKSVPDITDINVVKWSDKRLICKTSDPIPARMNIRGMFEVEFIRNDKG